MAFWVSSIIIASILVFAFRRARTRGNQQTAKRPERSPFQSVTVKWNVNACSAIKKLEGQRIICSDAPSFPLADCDASQCSCRYEFHDDRRDDDRRLLQGTQNSFIVTYGSEDKREQDDRRGDE